MSANRNHLQCISGHYRYRRRWPKNVRTVAKGEYFIRHLATSSLEEALRLRPAAEIEFFSEVDRLSGLVETKPRDVSNAEATMLVSRWFSAQVRQDTENDLHDPVSDPEKRFNALEGSRLMAEFVSDQVGSGDLEPFEVHASHLFEKHGIKADPNSPGFRLTAQLMARASSTRKSERKFLQRGALWIGSARSLP